MSLLDSGPDVLTVWPEVEAEDSDGNPVRVPAETPVTVRGRCQPVSAVESAALGQQVSTTRRFISRSFPAGAFAKVEWDGREWDVDGEPQWSNGSGRTQHVKVILTARGPEAI